MSTYSSKHTNHHQSGLFLSGVVMSMVYRLFDLDYNIFIFEG